MLGFSFGLLCRRGSDTEATTGWTDGKPWEIAWGELQWEGATQKRRQGARTEAVWEIARGSVDMVDGRETAGNSLGRGSETEVWTWWTDEKPREIAWEEGARRKCGHGGRTKNVGEMAWGELRPRPAKVSKPWAMGHA